MTTFAGLDLQKVFEDTSKQLDVMTDARTDNNPGNERS